MQTGSLDFGKVRHGSHGALVRFWVACMLMALVHAMYLCHYFICPGKALLAENLVCAALVSVSAIAFWLPGNVYALCKLDLFSKTRISTALGPVTVVVFGTLLTFLAQSID